jgi:hypothetical protein
MDLQTLRIILTIVTGISFLERGEFNMMIEYIAIESGIKFIGNNHYEQPRPFGFSVKYNRAEYIQYCCGEGRLRCRKDIMDRFPFMYEALRLIEDFKFRKVKFKDCEKEISNRCISWCSQLGNENVRAIEIFNHGNYVFYGRGIDIHVLERIVKFISKEEL